MDLQPRLEAALADTFGRDTAFTVRAPGRVNLIGEHTDYNGGFVLPCAIGVETRIAVAPRDDGRVRVVAADFGGETDEFALGPDTAHHAEGGWRDYVRGMAAQIATAHGVSGGADLAIGGDIPRGAGLSSSASLSVAVGFALLAAAERAIDPVAVALLAQASENDFVGVRCGNMDQLASAASVADAALRIDCRSVELTPVPIPADAAIMIVHSGIERGLVDGHYNRRREGCEEAAAAIGVPLLRDATLDQVESTPMSDEARRRARHIVTENDRVLAASDALAANDLVTLGRLMGESHASMRDDFEITVPAIDSLVALAADAIGAEGGARMTGGGFGGAIVAVLRADRTAAVAEAIRAGYRTPAGDPPFIMIEHASAGAAVLPHD